MTLQEQISYTENELEAYRSSSYSSPSTVEWLEGVLTSLRGIRLPVERSPRTVTVAERLQERFSERYRRVWVQNGKFSTTITLFPVDQNERYRFVFSRNRQVNDFEELVSLIEKADIMGRHVPRLGDGVLQTL